MKIAIAVENGKICGHFGHSPSFSFYEVEDGNIVSSENIKSPALVMAFYLILFLLMMQKL